jgi:hypothetical protein
MSGIATAVVAGTVATGYFSSRAQSNAADRASAAQVASSEASIAEQRRQFDAVTELLAPFIQAGEGALGTQLAIAGGAGPDAQRAAIGAIEASPEFQALTRQGENAILANASATGNLRGGNVQGALAQFRPNLLSGLIEQQYQRLGGLTQLGQASAAGQASAGLQTGQTISNQLTQQGQAIAGGALARGNATAGFLNNIGGTVGTLGTLKLLGKF